MISGVDSAWEALLRMEPEEVCRNAPASHDGDSGAYDLEFFSSTVRVTPSKRELTFSGYESRILREMFPAPPVMEILGYLIGARDVPVTGTLVPPSVLTGGVIYAKGAHVLPLDALAAACERSPGDFVRSGRELGGEELSFGDASVRLHPFPRLPVVLVFHRGDDEFPPDARLLFDSTCECHLPPDILWSTALMSVRAMLK